MAGLSCIRVMEHDGARRFSAEHRSGRGDVLFLAPGDVSKGRVEPISWMRTCEAYARHGLRVTLATLRTRRPDGIPAADVWRHFGVDNSFRILTLPTRLDANAPVGVFRLWAGAAAVAMAAASMPRAIVRRSPVSIVHVRAPVLLAPFAATRHLLPAARRPRLIFETHALPKPANGWIVRAGDLVVVNSQTLAHDIQDVFALAEDRVLYAPLPPFNPVRPHPKAEMRERLGLEHDGAIACYSGKLTEELVEFLLRAADCVGARVNRFRLLLVGGNPAILSWAHERVRALRLEGVVTLAGFVAPVDVAQYQSAADVLVYHMPERVQIFAYTTPAKGYEYQAIGRPIVATDFPLFGEVFGSDGDRALRVVDRTPGGLADGIVAAFALPDRGKAMVERAAAFVEGRTWDSRTALILAALDV